MLSLINLIEDKNNGYKGTLNDPIFIKYRYSQLKIT